ncbi:hypothetical protein SBADM41S_02625 [Streptomyces badius]
MKRPALRRTPGSRAPLLLTVPALLAVAFLMLPLVGVLARTSWGELGDHLTAEATTEALRLSLLVSLWSLGLSLLFGVPLAWLLARVPFPGKAFVRSLVLLPMVLPPTVGGVALLLAFGRRGLLGPWLEDTFGVTLPFHTSGAVLAATFVAMPFLVISLEGALGGLRPRYEETAASLGASPIRVFLTVTLPMVAPGLIAGAALTWARALGEFGATITFAGNLPGTTQTLPLQVYLLLQDSPEAATSVSLLLLAIAMVVLVALRGRWTGAPGDHRDPASRAVAAGPAAMAPDPFPEPSADLLEKTPPEPWPLHADVTGFTRLTLDAGPGTTIAVVGPNGAGKTTLLRALLGLTPRARAELRLGDDDVTGLPPHRRGVAWVPQDGALFPHLSALTNTAYGLRAHGVPRAEARRDAQGWLDRLGVGHLAHRKPAQLSGGQAQRVALARALAARPRLLLLDEPLAALDQTTRARVRHTLRGHLAEFGGVCLIVTHDPVEAVSLADRVLVLEDGRALQVVVRWTAGVPGTRARPGWPGCWPQRLARHRHRRRARPGGRRPPRGRRTPPGGHGRPRGHRAGSRLRTPGAARRIAAQRAGTSRRDHLGRPPAAAADHLGRGTGPGRGDPPAAAAELGIADESAVWTSVKATEVTVVPL